MAARRETRSWVGPRSRPSGHPRADGAGYAKYLGIARLQDRKVWARSSGQIPIMSGSVLLRVGKDEGSFKVISRRRHSTTF